MLHPVLPLPASAWACSLPRSFLAWYRHATCQSPPAPHPGFCQRVLSPSHVPRRSSLETEQRTHRTLWPRHRTCTEPAKETGRQRASARTPATDGHGQASITLQTSLLGQRPGDQREAQRKIPAPQRCDSSVPSLTDGETEAQTGETTC